MREWWKDKLTKVTEITGDPKVIYTFFQRCILPIGRELRIVRILYWKFSGHKYLWGMHQFIVDSNQCKMLQK